MADAKAAMRDNARYDLNNDTSMAKDYIEACRHVLERAADRVAHGDKEAEQDFRRVQFLLAKAELWWRMNDSNAASVGSIRHVDLRDMRA